MAKMGKIMSKEYLIEETIDDGEMFSRVGGKDPCCAIWPSHIETPRMVPQGILRNTDNKYSMKL